MFQNKPGRRSFAADYVALSMDMKTVGIILVVLVTVVGGFLFVGSYRRGQAVKRAIMDGAIMECPQDRFRAACVKRVEENHERCFDESLDDDQANALHLNHNRYRRCVGVPPRQVFNPLNLMRL